MRSVFDQLRRETMAEASRLTPAARIDSALRLGDADVALLASYRAISADEARRTIERTRHRGRRFSACHESLLE